MAWLCRKKRPCIWLTVDEDGEIIYRVKRLVDPDYMRAEVEFIGNVEEFVQRLKQAIEEGYITDIVIPPYYYKPEEIIKVLKGGGA